MRLNFQSYRFLSLIDNNTVQNISGGDKISILWRSLSILFISCFLLISVSIINKAQSTDAVMAENDARITLQALQLIERNQWTKAGELIARTRDPLATKLYYWLYYTDGPDKVDSLF